ncbi:hypothetical protein PMO31116_03777 [Pandoraea morbifera]|uniref:Lipoprotein n=1 Tax=Pandoraea morbifera TaxID=2508300 RepID=A0A5E4XD55_9BURK|nr:hypothetical protein [Pandoraea morbifera]VVE34247.1 hypothetical protein PMO31116_03777 [Pandoraea morbifera]
MTITLRRTSGALALILALTFATSAGAAPAADARVDAPMAPRPVQDPHGTRELRDLPPPPPGMGGRFGGPAFAAIRTVEEIARLYRVGGHPENVLPFYRGTLGQTHDPMLRRHLREAIAREELRPADTTAAIATLRAQLSEDLAALPAPDATQR